ncbi:MAG: ABC1 kinase family protein [Nitrospiria bacterium]
MEKQESPPPKPKTSQDNPQTQQTDVPPLQSLNGRFIRISWLAFRIFTSYFFYVLFSVFLPREKSLRWKNRLHKKNASRLQQTTLSLKGLLIKVGQFMSARVDILPEAYIETLSLLQDQVPPTPYAKIRKRLINELGGTPETIFLTFNKTPIASASLGQVHEATLYKSISEDEVMSENAKAESESQKDNKIKEDPETRKGDNKRVAVKIQYPEIEQIVKTDLKAIRLIVWVLQKFFKNIQFDVLFAEFSRIVHQELNYITEARQAERFKKNFKDDDRIIVPGIIWRYTTKHVLTMQFVEGIKISRIDQIKKEEIDSKEVATLLVESYMKQILKHRFFHGDPHPGNIFVQPGPRLVFVDFGLMQPIDRMMHRGLKKMMMAIIDREIPAIARGLLELGFISRTEKMDGIEKVVHFFMERYRDLSPRSYREITITDIAEDLDTLFSVYPYLQVPNHFILVGRTAGMLNGLCYQLDPDLNIIELAKPHAKRFVKEEDWTQEIFSRGKEVLTALIDLPVAIREFIEYANSGHFKTRMVADDLSGILTKIYNLAYRTLLIALIMTTLFFYKNQQLDFKSPEGIWIGVFLLIPSIALIHSFISPRERT